MKALALVLGLLCFNSVATATTIPPFKVFLVPVDGGQYKVCIRESMQHKSAFSYFDNHGYSVESQRCSSPVTTDQAKKFSDLFARSKKATTGEGSLPADGFSLDDYSDKICSENADLCNSGTQPGREFHPSESSN